MSLVQDHHPRWNYNEFLTYILIYAAHADLEFSSEEREVIKSQIDHEKAAHLLEEFQQSSDYEKIQIIQAYKGLYYPTNERRDEILYRIRTLFESDGKFDVMERNMFRMLKKIM
jgi:hypothetical protein